MRAILARCSSSLEEQISQTHLPARANLFFVAHATAIFLSLA